MRSPLQRDRLPERGTDITTYTLSHIAVRVPDWDQYVHEWVAAVLQGLGAPHEVEAGVVHGDLDDGAGIVDMAVVLARGAGVFVTQVVYDVNAAKYLVSDYRYECLAQGLAPVPIVFTFSVCGSTKTLEASFEYALAAARELIAYCRRVGVPFGLNVESVSIRRAEIEASVTSRPGCGTNCTARNSRHPPGTSAGATNQIRPPSRYRGEPDPRR